MRSTRVGQGTGKVPRQRQSREHAPGPPAPTSPPPASTGPAVEEEATATRWVGWVFFAAIVMTIIGAFEIGAGLTAIINSGYYVVDEQDLLVSVDYTVWGWVHLGLGALAGAAGMSLLAGRTWAKVVAIAMAMVTAVVNLAFLSAHPLWSLLTIALTVVCIYAIAVHGDEVTAPEL